MKKKIFYSAATLLFMAAMIFNVQFNTEKNDLASVNLEALMTANAKELVPGEGLKCFRTYSTCWFFGCTTIVSCTADGDTKCPSTSVDSWSGESECTR